MKIRAEVAEPAAHRQTIDFCSVVVIARNEERTIREALESVQVALGRRRHETVLVDSASTDDTVRRARHVPGVRVVRLRPSAPLGPALGRLVGQYHTAGDWILFLDGDMQLVPGWLEAAERAIARRPDLVGVAGELVHEQPQSGEGLRRKAHYADSDYTDATHLAGAALYRRDALARVGGFNPYLNAGEELELGSRLRQAGYRLRRLRQPMASHRPKYRAETIPELWRRMGRGFYTGLGQIARHAISRRLPIAQPLAPVSRHLAFFGLMLLGVACLVTALAWGRPVPIAIWLGLMALVFLAFAIRSRSLRKPTFYFAEWAIASPSVVWGFLQKPRGVAEFLRRTDLSELTEPEPE